MLAKVVNLGSEYIYNEVMAIIEAKRQKSENTARVYEDDFRQFCKEGLEKDFEFVTDDDLLFRPIVLLNYQTHLRESYSANSINRKIYVVKSIMKKLAADRTRDIDMKVFNILDTVEGDVHKNGVLTFKETVKMIELAKTLSNGLEKSLIIRLAAQTGIRLSAIISATWRNFRCEGGIWIFSTFDKGHKFDEKPIPTDLYNDLLKLKKDEVDNLFTLKKRTMQRVVPQLADMMGIPKERKIVFHSLKKFGVNRILDLTGDVNKAAQFANHEKIQTTYQDYANKQHKDYASMPSYTLLEDNIDLSVLENLTQQDLINIINQCSESTQADILSHIFGK